MELGVTSWPFRSALLWTVGPGSATHRLCKVTCKALPASNSPCSSMDMFYFLPLCLVFSCGFTSLPSFHLYRGLPRAPGVQSHGDRCPCKFYHITFSALLRDAPPAPAFPASLGLHGQNLLHLSCPSQVTSCSSCPFAFLSQPRAGGSRMLGGPCRGFHCCSVVRT